MKNHVKWVFRVIRGGRWYDRGTMARGLVLLLLSCPLFAQFSHFTATDDGRQLYFISTLQLAGDPPGVAGSRIFRLTGNILEPFAGSGDSAASSAYDPQVSGDGQTVGLTRNGNAELLGVGVTVLGPGLLTMSRNARWAVLTVTTIMPPPINSYLVQSTVINIATGERTYFPQVNGFTQTFGSGITSDGTVVMQGTSGTGLWRQGTFTPVTLPDTSSIVSLSDNAQVLIYSQVLSSSPTNQQQRLVARNLLTGNETVISVQPYPNTAAFVIGLSNDGQWALYHVVQSKGDLAFLANTATGQSTPLPLPNGEFAILGTLSGNGNLAFLMTTTGRIVSIDAQSGTNLLTLVAAPSWVPAIGYPSMFPGSMVRLSGKNLPATADAFKGRLFLDNIELPVIYANSAEAAVQVPWELQPPGPCAFRMDIGDSPFRQNQWAPVYDMLPQFVALGPGETSVLGFKAVRGDFSGLLTSQPNPGDLIVVYAVGLGPVNGPMVTGQPAPLDHTVAIQGQFECTFHPYGSPAETVFAGLAPGMLGIYQVNFRMPPGPSPGPITGGWCTYSGSGRNGGFTWNAPAPAIP